MWRGKKWVIVVVLAVVVVAGSVGGVALAADDESERGAPFGALWEKVCAIYEDDTGDDIDPEALQAAVAQAQRELLEEAMQNRLENLVEQGEITQAQADEYLEWWQARPDVGVGFGFPGHGRSRGMGGPLGRGGLTAHSE
jgi:hypothetical protein